MNLQCTLIPMLFHLDPFELRPLHMALDGVTSFLRLNDVTTTCKLMRRSLSIGGSSSVQWRKAEDFSCVFVVYCVLELK